MIRLAAPSPILVGEGARHQAGALAVQLGARRPYLITDPRLFRAGWAAEVQASLTAAGLPFRTWSGVLGEPTDQEVAACLADLPPGCDLLIALGGGSVIDLAKAVAAGQAMRQPVDQLWGLDRITVPALPLLALPSTAGSGAEVTSHAVIIDHRTGKKEVLSGPGLQPRAVLIDPALLTTLPRAALLGAALDGLVHALEAFLARRATAQTDLFARGALPLLWRALPRVARDLTDSEARADLALGGLWSGLALAGANAGVIHALGYPLTQRYGLPHGIANALIAPSALRLMERAGVERLAEVAQLLGVTSLAAAWESLLISLDLPMGPEIPAGEEEALAEAASLFRPVLTNAPLALEIADLASIYRGAQLAPRGG